MTAVDQPEQDAAVAGPRRWWHDRFLPVEVVLVALYALVRAWQSWGVTEMVFQDSLLNIDSAGFSLLSGELWAGQRTSFVPLVMKLTGTTQENLEPFVAAQVLMGVLAWGVLAATAGRRLPGGWRWVGTTVVLLVGLTTPITMWDHVVLTESLSVSLVVLAAAVAIWVVERPTWLHTALFGALLAALVLVRDSHIVFTGTVAVAAGVVAGFTWVRTRKPPVPLLVLVGLCLVLTAFGRYSTYAGDRHILPTRETLWTKVLPYEDRFAWFEARGMPDADRLRSLLPDVYPDPQTKNPIFPLPAYDDPHWEEFNEWVHDDANGLWTRWVLTHPVDALGDFFRRPKLMTNSAGDSWAFYRHPEYREFRLVDLDVLLFPPLGVVTVVFGAAVLVLWSARRRWWVESMGVVGLALVVTGIPHGIISYLGTPGEVARHALVPTVQLRVGMLLVILLALPEVAGVVRAAVPGRSRTAAAP